MRNSVILLFPFLLLIIKTSYSQNLLPPRNLHADDFSLTATWDCPRSIVLNEDFEDIDFPPTGWNAATQGTGWQRSNNGGSPNFQIPEHSWYAVTNDDLAGQNNNGCCDYLITPELNLADYPNYHLCFMSYYTGDYNSMAYVEVSIDGGLSWTPISIILPDNAWNITDIDLSQYSGQNFTSTIKLGFHFDDGFLWGSGWAMDNVLVYSDSTGLQSYICAIGDSVFLNTTGTQCVVPYGFAPFGENVTLKVAAQYSQGTSDYDSVTFTSHYLIPPSGLLCYSDSNQVVLSWNAPFDTITGTEPPGLYYYNIYRDDMIILSCPGNTNMIELDNPTGSYSFKITAIYNLTTYGFPGSYGESVKSTPCTTTVNFGYDLPFAETWDQQSYDVQHWSESEGWGFDDTYGYPPPCAVFNGAINLENYEQPLESYWINAASINTTSPYLIFLEYKLSLLSISNTGNEKLTLEIWNGEEWKQIMNYSNTISFNWISEKINISYWVKSRSFKLRFKASGNHSNHITSWSIDSIYIYMQYAFDPPENLQSMRVGFPEHNCLLSWEPPQVSGEFCDYVLDDGTAENGWHFNQGDEGWLGNVFETDQTGKIAAIDVFWQDNQTHNTGLLRIDVFNESKECIYSSAEFLPEPDSWQHISISDVPFNGDFYVMVHWNPLNTLTSYLGSDQDSLAAIHNNEWYYDGIAWAKLTDFGYLPCVFMIRAHVFIESNNNNDNTIPTLSPLPFSVPTISDQSGPEILKHSDQKSMASIYNPFKAVITAPQGYNIYFRYPVNPIPGGGNDSLSPWILLGYKQFPENQFIHDNISLSQDYYYCVTAVYEDGESIHSNTTVLLGVTSVEESEACASIKPNPANNETIIIMKDISSHVEIISLDGRLMYSSRAVRSTELNIYTALYPDGIYAVRISDNKGKTSTVKLLIKH
jgi:hypothetical protein